MVTNGRWDDNSLFVRPLWERSSNTEETEVERRVHQFQERWKHSQGGAQTSTISTRAWVKIKDDVYKSGEGMHDKEGEMAAHLMTQGSSGLAESFSICNIAEGGRQASFVKCCIGNLAAEPRKRVGSGSII
jgi:hypothetical protein